MLKIGLIFLPAAKILNGISAHQDDLNFLNVAPRTGVAAFPPILLDPPIWESIP